MVGPPGVSVVKHNPELTGEEGPVHRKFLELWDRGPSGRDSSQGCDWRQWRRWAQVFCPRQPEQYTRRPGEESVSCWN